MRNPLATAVSFIFLGLGFVSIIWVTSALSGRAHSQNLSQTPQQQVPPPSANTALPNQENDNDDNSDDGAMNGDPSAVSNPGAPGQTEAQPVLPGINPDGYTYDPTGRRDPFMPFGARSVLAQPMPMAPTVPSTLIPTSENSMALFDLAQLRVVAIVWDVKDPKAMIMDPKGKLHMLHKDSAIGRNNGFVYAIREGEIVVIEPTVSDTGVQSAMSRVMFLNGK